MPIAAAHGAVFALAGRPLGFGSLRLGCSNAARRMMRSRQFGPLTHRLRLSAKASRRLSRGSPLRATSRLISSALGDSWLLASISPQMPAAHTGRRFVTICAVGPLLALNVIAAPSRQHHMGRRETGRCTPACRAVALSLRVLCQPWPDRRGMTLRSPVSTSGTTAPAARLSSASTMAAE